jgi:hypothetical protein
MATLGILNLKSKILKSEILNLESGIPRWKFEWHGRLARAEGGTLMARKYDPQLLEF